MPQPEGPEEMQVLVPPEIARWLTDATPEQLRATREYIEMLIAQRGEDA